jgi:hypothetical protein
MEVAKPAHHHGNARRGVLSVVFHRHRKVLTPLVKTVIMALSYVLALTLVPVCAVSTAQNASPKEPHPAFPSARAAPAA